MQNKISEVWNAIKSVVSTVVNAIKTAVSAAWDAGVMLLQVDDLLLQGIIKLSGLSLITASGRLQGVETVLGIKLVPLGYRRNSIVAQASVRVGDAS